MGLPLKTLIIIISLISFTSCYKENKANKYDTDKLLVRIAELEIDPSYLKDYYSILKEEAEMSIRLESGVISIYPMAGKENPEKIKILEIYADQKAYELHLTTPHFKKYKSSTQRMVKSLKLIDMESIDKASMSKIFTKLAY